MAFIYTNIVRLSLPKVSFVHLLTTLSSFNLGAKRVTAHQRPHPQTRRG